MNEKQQKDDKCLENTSISWKSMGEKKNPYLCTDGASLKKTCIWTKKKFKKVKRKHCLLNYVFNLFDSVSVFVLLYTSHIQHELLRVFYIIFCILGHTETT